MVEEAAALRLADRTASKLAGMNVAAASTNFLTPDKLFFGENVLYKFPFGNLGLGNLVFDFELLPR